MAPAIDVAIARRLARDDRVAPHPWKYHAGKHGIGFQECVAALEHCYAVQRDERIQHEDAWYALAHRHGGRRVRVDFEVVADEDGSLLLIVTAYHV